MLNFLEYNPTVSLNKCKDISFAIIQLISSFPSFELINVFLSTDFYKMYSCQSILHSNFPLNIRFVAVHQPWDTHAQSPLQSFAHVFRSEQQLLKRGNRQMQDHYWNQRIIQMMDGGESFREWHCAFPARD